MMPIIQEPEWPQSDIAIPVAVVPHSREAEEATVGAVIINPSAYYEVAQIIKAEDFFIHRNRWIWEAFNAIFSSKTPLDMLTLTDTLAGSGKLQEIGGPAYLTALINTVPSSLNATSYAEIIRDASDRRKGINFANSIAGNAYNQEKEFNLAEQAGMILVDARSGSKRITTDQAAGQMIDLMSNPRFCTTGVRDIDAKIGGLFPAELSILAGYQGTGKSAAKLQGARRNAEQGKRVVLIDLEMTAAQTWFRMACGDLGVDVNQSRSGKLSQELQGQIISHAAELGEYYKDTIVIYQAPMTPRDILSVAMMEQPDIMYIDTLKNISGMDKRQSQQQWYDDTLKFLRESVAQSEGAGRPHVQVLHHINRSAHRDNRKPTLHDLMFAGESDADAIFILYRKPEDYMVVNDGSVKTKVPIAWITDKSRFGWTGEEEIMFRLVNQTFHGVTDREENKFRTRKDID